MRWVLLQKHCYVWQICLSIRTTTDRSAAGELLMWWWGLSNSLTPLLPTPGFGQPHKSPVSLATSMTSCKVWQVLSSQGTLFQIMVEWREACHLIIWCGKWEWKEKPTVSALWISRWVWSDTAWEKGERIKTSYFVLSFSLGLVPDTIGICCHLPLSSLQHFHYHPPKRLCML